MESQLQGSLISSLHSLHSVNWEEVQIATSSRDNMLLLLSAIEDGILDLKHQLPPPTTNSEDTCTAVMVSQSTRRESSYPTLTTTFMPVCSTCCPPGHISHDIKGRRMASPTTSKPPEPIAHTATGWPHHKRHYHPHLPPCHMDSPSA